jgi:hypothetical protein
MRIYKSVLSFLDFKVTAGENGSKHRYKVEAEMPYFHPAFG